MDNLNLEQRRCERLRNLLSPLYTLAQLIQEDEPEKLKDFIKKSADQSMKNWPLIEKALDPNSTLEELDKLYHDN